MKHLFIILSLILFCACKNNTTTKVESKVYPKVGEIERIDSSLDMLIPKNAKIEHLSLIHI